MKRKFSLTYILGIFLLLSLTDCASPPRIGYQSASEMNKGDEYKKVMTYLDREPKLEKEIVLKSTNEKYKISFYKRNIKQYKLASTQIVIGGINFGIIVDMYRLLANKDTYDLFVYTFKNDKLVYWGNIDDYKRSNDKVTNELGESISNVWLND